jgi:predicted metalloprotease with PDZ domain
MKRITYLLLLLLVQQVYAQSGTKLSYTVSPVKANDYSTFLIELKVKGSASGHTVFSIPYETGNYRPQDQIRMLNVTNGEQHGYDATDSTQYYIKHKPHAPLTIKYTVQNALKDSLPTLDEVYTQMLTPKYYYLIGHFLWMAPADTTAARHTISLKWKGFPAQWKHLNTYGANQLNQQLSLSVSDFQNAIYMGGDIRVHKIVINSKPLYLGVRGQWQFSDEELLQHLHKIVAGQRAYWNDYDFKQYVVGLIPMKYSHEKEISMNGRGLSNTFVTVGTNTKAFGLNNLTFLYNHELMHHWFGYVLQQAEPENAYKWFNEGFTDYFAHVVMRETGLFTEEDYKRSLNRVFSEYYVDSTNQWPNEKLQAEYWSSAKMQQLPYKRGLLFALYLDESIKKQTAGKASLKTVVQAMLTEARARRRVYSTEWLLQELQAVTGQDYKPQVEEYMIKGTFIPMAQWQQLFSNITLLPASRFDLGFTTETGSMTKNAIIARVQEGSNAQKAGLRVGDKLVNYNYTFHHRNTATFTVKRGEEELTLQYLPDQQVPVPQLK